MVNAPRSIQLLFREVQNAFIAQWLMHHALTTRLACTVLEFLAFGTTRILRGSVARHQEEIKYLRRRSSTTSEEFKEFNNVGGVQGGVQQVKYLRRRSSTTISTTEEFNNVTTLFNKSPSSLKDSKPTHRRGGALTSWNQRRVDSILKYISENAFPCQKGGVFPDPSAEAKRLKTFLYHRTLEKMKTTPESEHDQENDEE
jgi:hypothetical protein